MSVDIYIILVILTAATATFLTRILPFLLFDKRQKKDLFLEFLRKNMPIMIMVALVFYAVKEVEFIKYPYGIPELIGIISVFLLHILFKNSLLSIVSATVIYMALIQAVFI